MPRGRSDRTDQKRGGWFVPIFAGIAATLVTTAGVIYQSDVSSDADIRKAEISAQVARLDTEAKIETAEASKCAAITTLLGDEKPGPLLTDPEFKAALLHSYEQACDDRRAPPVQPSRAPSK